MAATTRRARIAGVIGAGALAASTFGMAGVASAAPATTDPVDRENARVTMSVTDSTPQTGDTITYSATFQRSWSIFHVTRVKQLVPSCLTYVNNSAKWEEAPMSPVELHDSTGADDQAYVAINGSWAVPSGAATSYGAKRTASFSFRVTSACATGEALTSSVHWNASIAKAAGSPSNAGPSITVAKATSGGNDGDGNTGGGTDGGGNDGGGDTPGGGDGGSGNDGTDNGGGNGTGGGGSNGSLGGGSSSGSLDLGKLF